MRKITITKTINKSRFCTYFMYNICVSILYGSIIVCNSGDVQQKIYQRLYRYLIYLQGQQLFQLNGHIRTCKHNHAQNISIIFPVTTLPAFKDSKGFHLGSLMHKCDPLTASQFSSASLLGTVCRCNCKS